MWRTGAMQTLMFWLIDLLEGFESIIRIGTEG